MSLKNQVELRIEGDLIRKVSQERVLTMVEVRNPREWCLSKFLELKLQTNDVSSKKRSIEKSLEKSSGTNNQSQFNMQSQFTKKCK